MNNLIEERDTNTNINREILKNNNENIKPTFPISSNTISQPKT